MKLIAQRGEFDLYDNEDGTGTVKNTKTGKTFKPFNLQSIIARGYWEPYTGDAK